MARAAVLVVDDEQGIRQSLSGVLGDEGYAVETVGDAAACLRTLAERSFDLLLLDIWLPDRDGLDLLSEIEQQPAPPEVVVISGHGSVEGAVKATKLGAFDFLEKPLTIDKTLLVVRHALEQRQLKRENRHLRQHFAANAALIGESVPLRALRQQIAIMAPTNGRVLIYGESGAGKELVARALHAQSERRQGLFIELNCAAIPEELIESELFGHVQGAFAGAQEAKEGKFSRADQGTLFLDEVGDMSLKTQAKVLRTLDEGRFQVLGATTQTTTDARIVAATNKNLEQEIANGNFREDLFYRLNVIPFTVPPLRERKEDIPLLARHFLAEFALAYGRKCRDFSPEALAALSSYTWPGNVRELRNLVERIAILNPTAQVIDARHLPPLLRRGRKAEADFHSLHEARAAYERAFILKKLEENAGNMTRTAEVLGLERSHLYRKMKSLGMTVSS
ncbi:MAG: sigma-54-dependent Fis family transcriptional regulator [Acidobacteria bacterium]|nr:MAG: sigma-54-dependent Fis family transcriptional regulator [Acidobacteriota bacterium]